MKNDGSETPASGETDVNARIQYLEKEIAELEARLPAHSTPPAMLMRLEELEDELEVLRAELARLRECAIAAPAGRIGTRRG